LIFSGSPTDVPPYFWTITLTGRKLPMAASSLQLELREPLGDTLASFDFEPGERSRQ
jgi:hypothetical protein